jgi:hypothetical protein
MEQSIILTTSASVLAFVLVLELVRQRKLREEYSLLWLATAFAMIIISAWRDLLHSLSRMVGIIYPPNFLFLLAALFTLMLLLYFSTVITRLTQESKDIAQEVALLRYELESLRSEHDRQQNERSQSAAEE